MQRLFGWSLLVTLVVQAISVAQGSETELLESTVRRYCVTCHNDRLRTAEFSLDGVDLSDLGGHAEEWEKVINKLRTRTMPPVGRPRPDIETYDALASWLESELDQYAAERPNPGRTEAFHRLNRAEYANAIRDLLVICLLYTSPSPRDLSTSRMPSSA